MKRLCLEYSSSSSKINKHLKGIIGDSIVTCDEVLLLKKPITTKSTPKNNYKRNSSNKNYFNKC